MIGFRMKNTKDNKADGSYRTLHWRMTSNENLRACIDVCSLKSQHFDLAGNNKADI